MATDRPPPKELKNALRTLAINKKKTAASENNLVPVKDLSKGGG